MGPAFILAPLTVTLGTPRRYVVSIKHNRGAFKPNRLYAHLPEHGAFTLRRVQWGIHGCEHLAGPIDLADFSMTQLGLDLALPRLESGEAVVMVVLYTGRVLQGLTNGAQFTVPIVWAEAGANLLRSPNITQSYSVE
jgi:hypothetical protein